MKWLIRYISSSIGKKHIMALTGIALFGFLLTHLAGNFLYFLGPEIFNKYAHALTSSPLIYPAEMGLLVIFCGSHLFCFLDAVRQQECPKTGLCCSIDRGTQQALV